MDKELIQLQLRQLRRLLDTKRLTFTASFCVIFSDYPTQNFLITLINYCDFDNELFDRLSKELHELILKNN